MGFVYRLCFWQIFSPCITPFLQDGVGRAQAGTAENTLHDNFYKSRARMFSPSLMQQPLLQAEDNLIIWKRGNCWWQEDAFFLGAHTFLFLNSLLMKNEHACSLKCKYEKQHAIILKRQRTVILIASMCLPTWFQYTNSLQCISTYL